MLRPWNQAAYLLVLALTSLAVLFASSAATAEDEPPTDARADLEQLQGLWQTSPGGIEHRAGKQVVRQPASGGPFFFVVDDRLIWLDGEGKPSGREARINLDVKAEPKRITLTPSDADGEKPSHGIYSITGSVLRVHFGLDDGPAPAQFLELNNPIEGVDGREWLVSRRALRDQ